MNKLVKLSVIGLVVVLALVVGVALITLWQVNRIAKTAIERGGSYALGVTTTVDNVHLSIFGGEAGLKSLTINNPEGYDGDFFKMNHAFANVNLASLRQEVVEIPEVRLTGLHITLVKKDGKANYQEILDNLARFQSKDKDEQQPGKHTFIVRKLTIADSTVDVDMGPGRRFTNLKLPLIELTDIPREGGGLGMAQMMDIITRAVLTNVLTLDGIPTELLNDLRGGLGNLVDITSQVGVEIAGHTVERLDQVTRGLVEGAGQIGGQVGEGLKDATSKAQEGLRDVTRGLGGILGGDKKEDEE